MPPSQYSLRLQHGITGGFAPPTPNAVHTIDRAADAPHIAISSATREVGQPSLSDATPKTLDDHHATSLVDELHGILKTLPTESPPGSEDIYGLDTTIAWFSDDLEWMNGGPQGCGGGTSHVKASEEDKVKFKRAVDIVNEIVKKGKDTA